MWQGTEYQWKSPSEHTIDGKRFDLELQVYHKPSYQRSDSPDSEGIEGNNGYEQAAISILFSTEKKHYQEGLEDWEAKEIIDPMFKSLMWDVTDKDPKSKAIKYADLLQLVELGERWTYDGSQTVPPCTIKVQWNILKQIYPVT